MNADFFIKSLYLYDWNNIFQSTPQSLVPWSSTFPEILAVSQGKPPRLVHSLVGRGSGTDLAAFMLRICCFHALVIKKETLEFLKFHWRCVCILTSQHATGIVNVAHLPQILSLLLSSTHHLCMMIACRLIVDSK